MSFVSGMVPETAVKVLRTYLLALTMFYGLAVVAELIEGGSGAAYRGEAIAVAASLVGLIVLGTRFDSAVRQSVAFALASTAVPITGLFHELPQAQVWVLVPSMLLAVYARTAYRTSVARLIALGISVLSLVCLVVAPAPVPALWLVLFPSCILASGEIFGGLHATLVRQALNDPLTGVRNRAGIEVDFAAMQSVVARRRGLLTVAVFDVDGFKQINDTRGHPAGDETLTAIADALSAALPKGASVGRLGGDEFVAVAVGPLSDHGQTFTRIAASLPTPASAGFAEAPADLAALDEMIAAADRDLYRSRRLRRAAESNRIE
ncbi:MAG: GGDEF domain-containing protein [Gordonia sp. (in: high G+C Gram-positive bacteria)]|uniref:GGDEF domain-containing protein n=1 Tax=Gordonia sp. (in: high G+C Gram-positive bacteria) TaxID=84139 RepID=UPI0039E5F45C